MRPVVTRLAVVCSVLLIAAGVVLFVAARNGLGEPAAAPLPTATFSADPAEAIRRATPRAVTCDQAGGARRVAVPDLDVAAPWSSAPVVDGWLAVPDDVSMAVALSGTDLADEGGTFLLAGHVDAWDQGAGAFYPLARSRPGMTVTVTGPDCAVTEWVITGLHVVTKGALPDWIYATTGPRRLALVTCGGPIIRTAAGRHYRDNVIVEAVPAG